MPDSLQEYLRLLHSRTDGAEEEVKECEIILEKLPPGRLSIITMLAVKNCRSGRFRKDDLA